jgi:hypothetical protein
MGAMAKPHTSSENDDAAHDVLAAEAFEVPAADPALHPRPVVLPDDPTGSPEPHDILAAEEFAMPAAPRPAYHPAELAQRRGGWGRLVAEIVVVLAVLRAIRRRRSSRASG